jgi:GNAT superfamily N-acetyltransferase
VTAPDRTELTVAPVTASRWADLTVLFSRGDPRGCNCMYFRLRGPEFSKGWGAGNQAALRAVVDSGQPVGLIGYRDGEPVGWVSVAPREAFLSRLERSRFFKPVPGDGVWSVLCFFVKAGHRRRGIAAELLDAAVGYARDHGALAVEGAPVEPGAGRVASNSAYTGLVGMFQAAGFTEIARRGNRPTYRLTFEPAAGPGVGEAS